MTRNACVDFTLNNGPKPNALTRDARIHLILKTNTHKLGFIRVLQCIRRTTTIFYIFTYFEIQYACVFGRLSHKLYHKCHMPQ